MRYLKLPILFLSIAGLGFWIGSGIFSYFTHQTPPVFSLKDMEENGYYAEQTTAYICADNAYKIKNVTITIDGKEFSNEVIKAKNFEHPFTIDTTTFVDGPHQIEFVATDSSYHANTSRKNFTFYVDNAPLRASLATTTYTVDQGRTAHIKLLANKPLGKSTVTIFNTEYSFSPESERSHTYESFIPVDCEEQPGDIFVTVTVRDRVGNEQKLPCTITVQAYEFKKQRGFSVNAEKLEEERATSIDDKVLREALKKWVAQSSPTKMWSGAFEMPISVQRMTTPFGEIRTNPDRGRYMHKGVDLINRPKCVVWASQKGKVIIKEQFALYGNTIVLDHGLGVFTLYGHLDSFANIEVGDILNKGNAVGKLGMTGYASGYHLHWELMVNNVGVDPVEWTTKIY